MKYVYYPGCSLKASGKPYEESLLSVFRRIGLPMTELRDWNCCGATAYMAIDELNAHALAARNLALAEGSAPGEEIHLVTPCNACFLVLIKAQRVLSKQDERGRALGDGLAEIGLSYTGKVVVRHPLDVLLNDVGEARLGEFVTRPLAGLKVACYYGCQVIRPYTTFDHPHDPVSMDKLLRAMGAETVDWSMKARCCGGTLTGTIEDVGLRLSYILLKEAKRKGADAVATACPLCQFNLECYQKKMERRYETDSTISVAYFTQLMGRAMGLEDRVLGLHRLLTPPLPELAKR